MHQQKLRKKSHGTFTSSSKMPKTWNQFFTLIYPHTSHCSKYAPVHLNPSSITYFQNSFTGKNLSPIFGIKCKMIDPSHRRNKSYMCGMWTKKLSVTKLKVPITPYYLSHIRSHKEGFLRVRLSDSSFFPQRLFETWKSGKT